jgi:hypothetical protein
MNKKYLHRLISNRTFGEAAIVNLTEGTGKYKSNEQKIS